MSKQKECVKVMMRCRPLSSTEMQENRKMVVKIDCKKGEIRVGNPKNPNEQDKQFTYDMVFDWNSSQEQVYQSTAYPIVESVLEGYNGTVFAYGQTGTGKTFTMEGKQDKNDLKGIIPRAIEHIFSSIEATPNIQFLVRASFLELYNEEIRDLLSKNVKGKLELRENPESGVYVKDLSAFVVQSVDDMNDKLMMGRKNRHVGETKMNQDSSRSHSIFQITVECCLANGDNQSIKVGKLNLVDLAGSERQNKTMASGDRFKEAVNINQSLTTLGNVISSLVDKSTHVPYRDSKLTRLLQDSLGGNTKTVMCANVGPADYNFEETLSTLRYATRAKSIQNKPKINEDPKDAMLREYQEEIQKLKEQLKVKMGGELNEKGELVVEVEKTIKIEDETMLQQMESKMLNEKNSIRNQMEQEVKRIEDAKNMAEDQKQKLLKKLEARKKKFDSDQKGVNGLIKQLKDQKEKILVGNQIKEEAKKKEKELHKVRLELEEREAQERRLKEELAQKEASQLNAEQKFNSLKEEIEIKTRKLNTLIDKYQEIKDQKNEIEDYRTREKEILMDENRQMISQIKLMDMIIEHLINKEDVEQLKENLVFSNEIEDWALVEQSNRKIIEQQKSVMLQLRPTCEFSRMAISFGDQNPRFRHENILQMDLDLPERTTEDFTGDVSQKLQETINVALMEDEDNIMNNDNDQTLNINLHNFMLKKQLPEQQRLQSAKRRPMSGKKKI